MQDNESESKQVTLRSGDKINLLYAVINHITIMSYLEDSPNHFRIIKDMALGQGLQDPDFKAFSDLRNIGYVTDNGQLNPNLRALFISSYRNTAEGELMVDPFAPATAEERVDLAQLKERLEHRVKNWRKYLADDRDAPGNNQGSSGPGRP